MNKKNEKVVLITNFANYRQVAAFSITLSGTFLSMQTIYQN